METRTHIILVAAMAVAVVSLPAQGKGKNDLRTRIGQIKSQKTAKSRIIPFHGNTRRFTTARKLAWIALSRMPALPAGHRGLIKEMLRERALADIDGHVARDTNGVLSMSLSSLVPLTRFGSAGLRCRLELSGTDKRRGHPGHLTYEIDQTRGVGVPDALHLRGRLERERLHTQVRLTSLGKGRGYLVREATVTRRHVNLDASSPSTSRWSLSYHHATADGRRRPLETPTDMKLVHDLDGLSHGGRLSPGEATLARSLHSSK